jgi:hypothetical protein
MLPPPPSCSPSATSGLLQTRAWGNPDLTLALPRAKLSAEKEDPRFKTPRASHLIKQSSIPMSGFDVSSSYIGDNITVKLI